jgi:hypothetical protein
VAQELIFGLVPMQRHSDDITICSYGKVAL